MKQAIGIWDRLIEIINNHKEISIRNHAKILLQQYNTAGGMKIKSEIENFLETHGY